MLKAKKIAQDELNASLAEQASILETDTLELRKLETAVANGATYEEAFASSIKNASTAAKEHAIQTKGVSGSTDVFVSKQRSAQSSLRATATASKTASVAMRALSMAMNMIVIGLITKGLELLGSAISNYIHRVEKANEKIEESRSSYEDAKSSIESMNDELKTTQDKIDDLQSKGTLSFTDKAELDNLKAQNDELERSISLEEKKKQNAASQTVNDIKQNKDTLSDDFEESIKNLSEYQEEYEHMQQVGIKGISDGTVTPENYEVTMTAMDKNMGLYEKYVLKNIEKFEKYKEDIINKYNTDDVSQFSQSDRDLYNSIVSQLQEAYKTIYSDSEYNKFVIEPIFDQDKLKGLQDQLLQYFVNGGSTDTSALEERFGTDIITSLRNACEKAGIDFDKMIEDMYNNSQSKLDQIAPMIETPNGAEDAKQNQVSKEIRNYIQNDLSEEDRTILLNAEIPDDVKFKTKQDVDNFIASLKKEADEKPISLLSISETVDAVNTKLKPALDSLKTVYQSIFSSDGFTLDDVDVSMLESLKKSFEDLKENGIDITTEDFEDFTRVITDSSTKSGDAQRAFNKLATTLVNNSKVTLVSDDAFNTLVQTLEQLGITNAEEALQGLRDTQSEIASKGYDLANITNEQAAAFINEGNASAEAVAYLQYYMIQKQLAEQPLSTVGDVESLENLCNTLGVTGEMLQEVINLKNMMNAVNAGAPTAEFMPRIEESKKKIAELAKGEFEYKFDFKPELDSSKASGSAKDIAEEFKNLLDAELKVLDTKMDAGLINFNDYIAQRLALIQKYYDEGKIKASDYYDYLSKHYETQLSYMDKVTSYVTTRIDKEIDSYNKQIDQIKEKYQTEIDYLDTVIDYYEKQKEALQDANTQRELQLALQKALYDLEKAQTQRSRKIYADNHGYIYRADGDAIRDAQDNLNKAKLDIQINEIDKAIKKVQEQQDALKKAMDKEVEAINKIIENLEAYKEKWSSIAKEYEEKQNEMIAQQMLGADIEKEILAGRLDVLEDFKNKYLAIQQAIKDANANAAQAALNEANKPSTGGSGSGSGSGTKITTTPKSPLVSDTEKKRIQEENKKKNKKKKQRLTGGGRKKLVTRYANGTKNAEPGYHEIAENGDELIRDNYGNAYIAKGHQLHNFEGGETVYDAGDTKELLGGRLVPIESMPGISESLKNLMAYANTPDASQLRIQPNIPDYNMLKSVDSKSSTNSQVYVTQNVNVTLPNVTNEAGFNNFKKELDRLKLDAYQFANKRNK